MRHEIIHLEANLLNRRRNIFLLLLPSLIFFLILFLFFTNFQSRHAQVAVSNQAQETAILGESDEGP